MLDDIEIGPTKKKKTEPNNWESSGPQLILTCLLWEKWQIPYRKLAIENRDRCEPAHPYGLPRNSDA